MNKKLEIGKNKALQFLTDEVNSTSAQYRFIDIDKLVPYRNHPFTLYQGERMNDMVESVKQNGVIVPIIVRPIENDMFEILSGHNRTEAAKRANLTVIAAVVKENLSEDEALLYVVETNVIQRGFNEMKPSEKAAVLSIEGLKIFSQGKRNDIQSEMNLLENRKNGGDETLCLIGTKLDGYTSIGEEYGLSRRSVARLLRINKLTDALKEKVDSTEIGIYPAVEISYLRTSEQNILAKIISENDLKLDTKKAKKLRALSEKKTLTPFDILDVLIKKVRAVPEEKFVNIKIRSDIYSGYFDENVQASEIEQTVIKALDLYFNR